MNKYRIPVRVITPPVTPSRDRALDRELAEVRQQAEETARKAVSSGAAQDPVNEVTQESDSRAQGAASGRAETKERERPYRSSEDTDWRDFALRLQADMAAFRRRQKRVAHEEARAEQAALLRDVLVIADNLDRALAVLPARSQEQRHVETLARGVELTRLSLERTLTKHGLERIQVEGEPFDPTWHEAVHVVPAATFGVEPGTVVEVLEAGYRRQDALFRPAKVVVAQ